MDNFEVIGIDHGWSHIKTWNEIFPTAIHVVTTEPAFWDDVLEYEGKYYKVGGERLDVKDNKVGNDDFYLLTLVALAKELGHRGKQEANVVLAAGLPATRFGDEKKGFFEYLSKKEEISFIFEQRPYHIKIAKVAIFPQCYAAVVEQVASFGQKVVVVDIGSWTIDIIPVVNKKPDDTNGNTISEGLITCMRSINKECSRQFNEKLDELDIQHYIMTKQTDLPKEFKAIMDKELVNFAERIYNSLREEQYSLKTMQFYFVGGGASVMKNFGGYEQSNIKYNLDVHANAKGFEKMARIALNARR